MNILVTAGTGKTGSRVAQHLTRGGHPVRAATRHGSPPFDWHDPSTWDHVLGDCTAAYVAFSPDLGLPGADEVVGAFARRAVAHDCRRLVLLSGRGEEGARRAEQAVVDSGADWTILRSAFFLQNFTESFLADEIAHGSLTMIAGAAAEPFVDADDVAEVAVAALLDPSYAGGVLELTGPALLTFEQVAHQISGVSGRAVTYREVTVADYVAGLVTAGLTEADAAGLAHLFHEVLDGRNAHLDDGVSSVLGRPPRDLEGFLTGAFAPVGLPRG